MRTAAEAFSGENNILPLDGRGLGKHTSQATLPSAATAISLPPTPPPLPPPLRKKMVRSSSVLAEQHRNSTELIIMGLWGGGECLSD